jgi:uncharacterized protein YegL
MDNSVTEIIFVLDKSGSMESLTDDTIGGFNSFVKKQVELGKTKLTTVLFDTDYKILHDGIDAVDVRLTRKDYEAGGCTALLDAVGKTIHDVKKRLKETSEETKPGKVIFIITTDGYENSSREYTYADVKKKIEKQTEKLGWEFIFMGANIDVAKESESLGIRADRAFSFAASTVGVSNMYCDLHNMSKKIRAGR